MSLEQLSWCLHDEANYLPLEYVLTLLLISFTVTQPLPIVVWDIP